MPATTRVARDRKLQKEKERRANASGEKKATEAARSRKRRANASTDQNGCPFNYRDIYESTVRLSQHGHGSFYGGHLPAFIENVAHEPRFQELLIAARRTQIRGDLSYTYEDQAGLDTADPERQVI